jgi:multidrug efflux pump subunit AcrB
MVGFPDTPVFVQRGSLLSVDGNNAREIRLYFQGADLSSLMDSARVAVDEIPKAIEGAFPQTFPSLELNQPELQLIPDEWRIARSGLTRTEVAASVRAFTGGLWAGEYFDGNERLDIIVKANEWRTPEELAELPIVTPTSGVQTVGELAQLRQTVGPAQLVRVNGHRTVSVNFEPPEDMTLDEALRRLKTDVEPKVRKTMDSQTQLTYAGSANDLHQALGAMAQNFALALLILFALMAALFRSVRDSLLVMLVMPASIAGGIAALRVIGSSASMRSTC